MTEPTGTYHGKIILFGEYTVICGSSFLSAPYGRFSGRFGIPGETGGMNDQSLFPESRSRKELWKYLDFLKGVSTQNDLLQKLDLSLMEKELANGLYFMSEIMEQYGLGSSGALCAAVFDRYFRGTGYEKGRVGTDQLPSLKEAFSLMEGYFHDSSSGMDPLVSYSGKPVLIHAGGKIETVALPVPAGGSTASFFLYDTGMRSRTGPLVALFREKYRNPSYRKEVQEKLVPATERCISAFLKGEPAAFMKSFRLLSSCQLTLFREMIPEPFTELWREGLETGAYCMKLCGSGGGGFLLGYSMVALQETSVPDRKGRILTMGMEDDRMR